MDAPNLTRMAKRARISVKLAKNWGPIRKAQALRLITSLEQHIREALQEQGMSDIEHQLPLAKLARELQACPDLLRRGWGIVGLRSIYSCDYRSRRSIARKLSHANIHWAVLADAWRDDIIQSATRKAYREVCR